MVGESNAELLKVSTENSKGKEDICFAGTAKTNVRYGKSKSPNKSNRTKT